MQGDREAGRGTGGRAEEREGREEKSVKEIYDEAALFLFPYCGFTSFEQVDQVTIPEYRTLVKAARLREVDKDYRNHLQAFLNLRAKDKKKTGKKYTYIYPTFEKFYDYEKEEKKAIGVKKPTVAQSLSKAIGDIYRNFRGKEDV